MRLPVQVWTPFFWRSPFQEDHARDLRRAQREWQGEHRVWLDPSAKKVERWTRVDQGDNVHECIIPSETVNYFVIAHVDGEGRVYPNLPLPKEWEGVVSGAYIRWLREEARIYRLKSDHVLMPMPVIKDGRVSIIETAIELRPGAITPDVDFNDGKMEITWRKSGNAEMLAIDHEIEAAQGRARYERRVINGEELLIAVSEENPKLWSFALDLGWDKPFSYMLGEGGGMDVAMHQAYFKRCIEDGDSAKAMKEAETWLSLFTSPGKTSIWHSWFAPMASANAQEALFALESQYNVLAATMEELYRSEQFRELMDRPVDVVIANDWLGYMWWDFYQDLQEKITIRCCQSCGRVIRGGHRDRQFCNRSENPECFRKRNTTTQRKKRTHKS